MHKQKNDNNKSYDSKRLVTLYSSLVEDESLNVNSFKPSAEVRKKLKNYREYGQRMMFEVPGAVPNLYNFYKKFISNVNYLEGNIENLDRYWQRISWATIKLRATNHESLKAFIDLLEQDPSRIEALLLNSQKFMQQDAQALGTPMHMLLLYTLSKNTKENAQETAEIINTLLNNYLEKWGKEHLLKVLIFSHHNATVIPPHNTSSYRSCLIEMLIEHCETDQCAYQTIDAVRKHIKSLFKIRGTGSKTLKFFNSREVRYLKTKLAKLKSKAGELNIRMLMKNTAPNPDNKNP